MSTRQYDNFNDLVTFTRSSGGTALRPISYGPELVTNGTFDTDTSGWTPNNLGLLSVSNQLLKVETGSNAGSWNYGYQEVSVVVGKTYRFKASSIEGTATKHRILLGTGFANGSIVMAGGALGSSGDKSVDVSFTATTASVYVALQNTDGVLGSYTYLDNVSVKEVLFDQAGAPLTLFNHLTDTPRIEYNAAGERLGLLVEEARTNLVTYSEDFSNTSWPKVNASVSSDSSIAPDGNQTADTLTATSASANVYRYHTSGPFNSTVTFSVWLKRKTGTGTVSVGGTSVTLTSEWQLFTKDFAIGASGSIIYPGIQIATSGDEVYAWGAQLEAGAFPTSYIPTSGATATRAADVCSMPVSAFGYNKSEGSLVVDANPIPSGSPIGDQGVVSFDNGTTTDEIILLNENNDRCRLIIDPSGGAANDVNMSLSGAEGSEKYAAAWRINDAQIAHGGLIGAGDTSTTPPTTITRLNVGSVPNIPLNGHIKSIKYYPRRLSNAQLVELTS